MDTPEPWRPNTSVLDNPEAFGYKVFTRELRRGGRRRAAVLARGAGAPARLPRPRAAGAVERRRPPRQPAAAPAAGAAEPRLGLRPGRRHARRRAPDARHHRSHARADVQARARHGFPRHRRHAAARQFRLHARPPDHGGRLLRRHPGAHAGALRREGGDPRLHDARLEGRAGARAVARRRQAAGARAPQRPAPHRLQDGRCAVAARQALARPDDARGSAEGEHRRRGARLGAPPPAGAARAAPHSDDDFRRRAGRRLRRSPSTPAATWSSICGK